MLQRLFLFIIFLRDSVIESIVFQTYRNGYRSQREYRFYLYKDEKIVASKKCGSYETECERLKHVARRCNKIGKADEDPKRILDESGEEYPWMAELSKKR